VGVVSLMLKTKRLCDVFLVQLLHVNAIRSLSESGLRLPAADGLQEHITRIGRCCGIVGDHWIGIAQAVGRQRLLHFKSRITISGIIKETICNVQRSRSTGCRYIPLAYLGRQTLIAHLNKLLSVSHEYSI
jgi:hypothetical protein